MANVSHASLTGSNLHEPKGIETATSGQAYLANGAGSGAWTTLSGLSLTGAIAPWLTPIAPSGWYELNGATISSVTDSALYNVMTIQQTATRVSGSAVISGIPSTANFKVGYYIFGTGITAGTTILSIDSPTDITMSANATSSGSSNVIVSPWVLGTNTITLPDLTTSGRYLRSRTSSFQIGQLQSSQNKGHTHGFTTTGDSLNGTAINTGTESVSHTHTVGSSTPSGVISTTNTTTGGQPQYGNYGTLTTSGESATHYHSFTMPGHTHTGTTDADTANTEARPETLVVMWCVKR